LIKYSTILLLIFLSFTNSAYGKENSVYSFWIKVVDQNQKAITGATIFYCIFDCRLKRNAHNQKKIKTNERGLAELKFGAKDQLRIQGVVKEGYDIRLSTLPYTDIRLKGLGSKITRFKRRIALRGINVQYDVGATPYSLPMSEPLFVLNGWKLGLSACFEKGQQFILHDGQAESKWAIDDAVYYYKVGDDKDVLREGSVAEYDFKITVNRSFYPWGNLINSFRSSYKLEFEFNNGGGQILNSNKYVHLAPSKRYKKKLKFRFKGIGDVASSHFERLFFRVNDRYGVLNMEITPSQRVFIDYLLNRKVNQKELNIPSYVGELAKVDDYFVCPGVASVLKAQNTLPNSCAELGLRSIGC